ncbi:MAG: SRPBCC family protein [Acidimicrobiia bacterium]|nr:SRPBCC family protein [Acidimicrobiia bacterium]
MARVDDGAPGQRRASAAGDRRWLPSAIDDARPLSADAGCPTNANRMELSPRAAVGEPAGVALNRRLALAGVAAAAATVAHNRLLTPWHQRWGATDEEVDLALTGDDLVPEPATQATRAITIDAAPADVWPWIVQLGADRGGFYSYDWLENLFGLQIHSAEAIEEAWQDLQVGDLVYANRAGTGGWCVVGVHPHEALVLQAADVTTGRPLRRDEQLGYEFLWIFALRPTSAGATRLLVRERSGFRNGLTEVAMSPIGLISFVMSRRMLRGIKQRAEAS